MTQFGDDHVAFAPNAPIVIVGGSGVVGRELGTLLEAHDPALPVCVTSRRPAANLPRGVRGERVDLTARTPLRLEARAVVALVNDPTERLLRACVSGGVPFVDVTRYTPRMLAAIREVEALGATAPVVLASGWMGGVVPVLARALQARLGELDGVRTSIVYDLADRAGPDSIEFMDRMDVPFEVHVDGAPRPTWPLACAGTVEVGGRRRAMLHFDTPEQLTMPRTLGARTVVTRIGFSSELATCSLHLLDRAGFFRALRGERFRALRRGLLASSGSGGVARLRVDAWAERGASAFEVVDPAGQAHLTAVGARLALGFALGLDGSPPAKAGVLFPEQIGDAERALDTLRARGVVVEEARFDDDSRRAGPRGVAA